MHLQARPNCATETLTFDLLYAYIQEYALTNINLVSKLCIVVYRLLRTTRFIGVYAFFFRLR